LVAGIVQFVLCPFIGAIVAIVCGHIAQRQIRESRGTQGGSGIARAGTILGYVGLALTALAIAALIVVFGVFGEDITRAALRDEARDFVDEVQEEALFTGSDVRDPDVLRNAYSSFDIDDPLETLTLPDGTRVPDADLGDWERARWRVELHGSLLQSAEVCAEIPPSIDADPRITDGRCDP
jgi:hypothetical protein